MPQFYIIFGGTACSRSFLLSTLVNALFGKVAISCLNKIYSFLYIKEEDVQ